MKKHKWMSIWTNWTMLVFPSVNHLKGNSKWHFSSGVWIPVFPGPSSPFFCPFHSPSLLLCRPLYSPSVLKLPKAWAHWNTQRAQSSHRDKVIFLPKINAFHTKEDKVVTAVQLLFLCCQYADYPIRAIDWTPWSDLHWLKLSECVSLSFSVFCIVNVTSGHSQRKRETKVRDRPNQDTIMQDIFLAATVCSLC